MQSIFQITLLVPDYDAGIQFYVDLLGFALLEDTAITESRRWVVVSAQQQVHTAQMYGCAIVFAVPENEAEAACIGQQTANRVGFFLGTDDCERDYKAYTDAGVEFEQPPQSSQYGTVAIFKDPFGNRWDLIEHAPNHRFALSQQ